MNSQYKQIREQKQRGFTIIEVVLVLAIAGLIFLMVFIALPALQRGQRDTQRKDDVSRVSTQVSNYSSSNRGKVPDSNSFGNFVLNYLGNKSTSQAGDEYQDPSAGNYNLKLSTDGVPAIVDQGTMYYSVGKICTDDGTGAVTATGANARSYSIQLKLENQTALYCVDNR